MKIIFLVPSREARGPNIFVRNLTIGLRAFPDVFAEVLYFKEVGDLEFPVPARRLCLAEIKNLRKADIVQSTMLAPDLILRWLPFRRITKVTALHNLLDEDVGFHYSRLKAVFISWLWYRTLRRLPNLIYSSVFMQRYYRRKQVLGSSVCIEYGIPHRPAEQIDEADQAVFSDLRVRGLRIVGCVCLLIPRKGLEQLIPVLQVEPDWAVVIIGEGPIREQLARIAREAGVEDRFILLGFRERSYRYNACFDVFAMVSRSEGFCMAMLEAMDSQTPVVSSKLPIYDGFFKEDIVPSFELDDYGGLRECINTVLKSRGLFSERVGKLFRSRFSLEAMARAHADFYGQLLARGHFTEVRRC